MKSELHEACARGLTGDVQLCLDRGADVHFATYDGTTALHIACKRGYVGVATLCLEHGAVVDSEKNYNCKTPLSYACQEGHVDVMTLLGPVATFDRGANLHRVDWWGESPLFDASRWGQVDAVATREITKPHDAFKMQYAGLDSPRRWWSPKAGRGPAAGCRGEYSEEAGRGPAAGCRVDIPRRRVAAPPRGVAVDIPWRERTRRRARLHGISTSQPRRRRDPVCGISPPRTSARPAGRDRRGRRAPRR